MRSGATRFSEAEASQRYKTALGRALVYNLEIGIDWKLDARGRLEPVPISFVGGPSVKDRAVGPPDVGTS